MSQRTASATIDPLPQLHSTALSAKAEELSVCGPARLRLNQPPCTRWRSYARIVRVTRSNDGHRSAADLLQGLYMYGCKVDIRATVTRLSRRFLSQAREHPPPLSGIFVTVGGLTLPLSLSESPAARSRRRVAREDRRWDGSTRSVRSGPRTSPGATEAEAEGVSLWPLGPGVSAR